MSRPQKPGTIQFAVRQALDATGEDDKDIADFLGIRGSTLSYGTEESETRPGGLGVNYLHRLALKHAAAAVPLAKHFARKGGGMFVPHKPAGAGGLTPLQHAAKIVKESGEAVTRMISLPESGDRESARSELVDIRDAAIAAIRDIDAEEQAERETAAATVAIIPHRGQVS